MISTTRDAELSCWRPDHCAAPSPYQDLAAELATAAVTGTGSTHTVNLLDDGQDALVLRLHLIRSARRSIDMQYYIFATDDSGQLILDELLAAARRGVKVRLLLDQLSALNNLELLTYLAQAHVNFELRIFNPTFDKATSQPLEYFASVLCCFKRFNRRAHNKLLLVDQRLAIIGGRNIEDRYFDLDPGYNYHDRDILVVGPRCQQMRRSFNRYWRHPLAHPMTALRDIYRQLLLRPTETPRRPAYRIEKPDLIATLMAKADDPAYIEQRFYRQRFPVQQLAYFADPPAKHGPEARSERSELSDEIATLIGGAEHQLLMQTPYLVLSKPARRALLRLRRQRPALRMIVSTNSLAATDNFPVYAISFRQRRLHLKTLGFELYEYKPYSGRSEVALRPPSAASLPERVKGRAARHGVPLKRDGHRRRLHAKSIVIDDRVALIGSHNFDPRSHNYNTENGVIVWDADFAAALKQSILADIAPDQSWVVARKQDVPVLTTFNQSIEWLSSRIPFFDFWPFRYATSFELRPECDPMPVSDPHFYDCHVRIGDFPEVRLSGKSIYTRIISVFGGGLEPIL
ncbi:MAG: phospholipase D family protein [Lysobacterales bacterium]